MAAAVPVEVLLAGILNTDGNPLTSGKVYTKAAGTTTDKTTWTDKDKTTAAANPIVLDAYGRAVIFADGEYKFYVGTSASTGYTDNIVYTWDGLSYLGTAYLALVTIGSQGILENEIFSD